MLRYFQHFYNSEVCSTFTLISALCCCTEVPPILATPLPGRGLLQVLHVEVAALLLGVPASRALPRLTEGSKVPGTGGVHTELYSMICPRERKSGVHSLLLILESCNFA